jgi:hypothetical protein
MILKQLGFWGLPALRHCATGGIWAVVQLTAALEGGLSIDQKIWKNFCKIAALTPKPGGRVNYMATLTTKGAGLRNRW